MDGQRYMVQNTVRALDKQLNEPERAMRMRAHSKDDI